MEGNLSTLKQDRWTYGEKKIFTVRCPQLKNTKASIVRSAHSRVNAHKVRQRRNLRGVKTYEMVGDDRGQCVRFSILLILQFETRVNQLASQGLDLCDIVCIWA